jgi:aspartate beta-hydroxylase
MRGAAVDENLKALADAAGAAAAAGRWQDAEHLWSQVRARDPGNVQALYSLGVHAFQRGDLAAAIALLDQARQRAPSDPMIPLTLGRVQRQAGQPPLEWAAIIAALDIDPYFLPGLLAKAEFLERQAQPKAAAAVFRDVLKVALAEAQWPQALRRRLEHARDMVERDGDELIEFLRQRVGVERASVDALQHGRWDEAVAIMAGRSAPYHSQCNQLHVPRLPALTFHDPAQFPWIPVLQAQTAAIQAELQALVQRQAAEFVPYVAYAPGTPVNQWGELNHSRAWSSYHLWAHGQPVEAHLAQCPRTAEALSAVERVDIAGLCPNAMFSALQPHTRIPPHTGETNARLVAHLPLVVPERCAFRVGYDWRPWEEGKVFVFDDSIEHEARNDSDQLRVVLIFDVWNPLLSLAERDMVAALSAAMQEFRASGTT